jgi:two-component system, LytTR family, response regulator
MNSVPSNPSIRTLIVEDELPARLWLRALCDRVAGIQVVKECATAAEASRALQTNAIDLLLLDIELGPHKGFDVLDNLPDAPEPHLIVVTAHEQYALQAFENRAVDYLLKPVREDRFRDTVARIQQQLRDGKAAEMRTADGQRPAASGNAAPPRPRRYMERLTAERDGSFWVIDCRRITTLESAGNYVRIHESGDARPASIRGTLQGIGALLDPDAFVRINRSVVVNMAFVEHIERDAHSHFIFVMREDGRTFNVGRTFHSRIARLLKP